MEIREERKEEAKEEMTMWDTDPATEAKEAESKTLFSAMQRVTDDLKLSSDSNRLGSTEEEKVDPNTDDKCGRRHNRKGR
jgi:hypothetical protein